MTHVAFPNCSALEPVSSLYTAQEFTPVTPFYTPYEQERAQKEADYARTAQEVLKSKQGSLFCLPCENNGYSLSTVITSSIASATIALTTVWAAFLHSTCSRQK